MQVLVTGGLGFIGSNFVRYFLEKYPEHSLVNIDFITYAGNPDILKNLGFPDRYTFIKGNICDRETAAAAMKDCDVVYNFAAETHVDRSITHAEDFVKTDVIGTSVLLDLARKYDIEKFIQISTDEVYGSTEKGSFREDSLLDPSSPYSASKASADLLVRAYGRTYGLPAIITRSSNNFGPYQYPEKLIPRFITNALMGKTLPVYGDGRNVRDWIYVLDNCAAIDLVSTNGKVGEIYNIASSDEKQNIEITRGILEYLGKPESCIRYVADRPGHDRRYSLDTGKLQKLGWKPAYRFETALRKTVQWYRDNEWWWAPLV
jgi:dTDP-glucose 4,6-dehydratase